MKNEDAGCTGKPFADQVRDMLGGGSERGQKVLEVLSEFLPGLTEIANAVIDYQTTKFLEVRSALVKAGVPDRQASTAAREIVVAAFNVQRRAGQGAL